MATEVKKGKSPSSAMLLAAAVEERKSSKNHIVVKRKYFECHLWSHLHHLFHSSHLFNHP